MSTGERIKSARKAAGMTQSELAEKLDIPYQSISQWERDVRKPKLDTLQRIADALGTSLTELTNVMVIRDKNGVIQSAVGYAEDLRAFIESEDKGDPIESVTESMALLNRCGQKEAAKRVHELTLIPEYRALGNK